MKEHLSDIAGSIRFLVGKQPASTHTGCIANHGLAPLREQGPAQATEVRRQYEEKIKGLMPAELQKELEDTITSLKAQVNFLQKRAAVLQEDLDACRGRSIHTYAETRDESIAHVGDAVELLRPLFLLTDPASSLQVTVATGRDGTSSRM
ncbi:Centrosomal protein of 112 kDa [Takifugu flavidus]|uniref:Centrosomal protein of 112 kDa n=1 Tax=Takifugu flavidus TaxID=433684 RepID=A0A5C6NTV6_9TELE|nr:Centrosomal protein of 112 kDa [Takifugu flavidus]